MMNRLSNAIHPNRRILAVSGGTVVLLAGFLAGLPQAGPPPVYASCQAPQGSCGLDLTRTGAVIVSHQTTGGTFVEPNTGESWTITATWVPQFAPCTPQTENAYATVDWNGSGWTLSNITTTNHIIGIGVCDVSGSCGSAAGPRAYMLKADINHVAPGGNLQSVTFTTTSVDDGYTINMSNCTTTSTSVTPTSQTFSATDFGTFECDYACANVVGPTLTITY
jgi:hypothetical protein